MKFKAKPMPFDYEPFEYDWLEEKMDDDGYVTGYYVDGYIVGKFVEVNKEYTHLEFWVPVLKDTLELVEELEE